MPLNASGTLSIGGSTAGQSINLELGRAATASSNLNESGLRTLAGVASGQISISNFYGKSNITTFLLLAGGWNVENRTIRYSYTNFSNSTSTNLTYSHGSRPQGTSTSTIGYVFGGRGANYGVQQATTRFTYSNSTVAAGTNLNVSRYDGASFGNATVGILTNGFSPQNQYTTTSTSYTYSNNTSAATTAINAGSFSQDMPTAGNNSTIGYIAFGSNVSASRRWTFSNATVATGTVLSSGYNNGQACQCTSTTTNSYFQGQSCSKIYNFAGNSVSNMTAVYAEFGPRSAGGDGTLGLYFSGTGAKSYTYSNNTITQRTNLIASSDDWAACSNPPGSF